jgi:hypothetical protein
MPGIVAAMRALWWIALIVMGLVTLVAAVAGSFAVIMQAAALPIQSALYALLLVATVIATVRSLIGEPRRGSVLPAAWGVFLVVQAATALMSDAYTKLTCEEQNGVRVVTTECDGDGMMIGLVLFVAAVVALVFSMVLALRPRRPRGAVVARDSASDAGLPR